MKSIIFITILIAACLAEEQESTTPRSSLSETQGQIQYVEPEEQENAPRSSRAPQGLAQYAGTDDKIQPTEEAESAQQRPSRAPQGLIQYNTNEATEEEESVPQRPSRTPQGHIQYSDPDGLKVSWKLYAPYTQWRSHLENPQRNQRAELGTVQPSLAPHQVDLNKPSATSASSATASLANEEKPTAQPIHQLQVQYKPYSMVPTHIKQLILEMYEPQGVYVDPAVYIYRANPEQEEQKQEAASEQHESAQTASELQYNAAQPQPRFEHIPKYQTKYPLTKKVGFIQYKDEQPTAESSAAPQYGSVPERQQPSAEEEHAQQQQQQQQQQQPQQQQQQQQYQYQQLQQFSSYGDNMPKAIHQLLNLQAQTPYHVIANRIYYKPKSLFVPKPLSDESKGIYKYRTKVYYIKDTEDAEQDVKERPEREEPKEEQEQEE